MQHILSSSSSPSTLPTSTPRRSFPSPSTKTPRSTSKATTLCIRLHLHVIHPPNSSPPTSPSSASLYNVSSGNMSFYNNRILERYAAKETKRVTLRQLTVFGRNLTEDKLLRSGTILAHRIRDFQHLPFIVGTNPHIEELYALYWDAFERFRTFREIKTMEDNREFCDLPPCRYPKLALGIAEAAPHMSLQTADRFFNEMLRSRIGRRVLAEQHITLSAVFDVVDRCASLASRLFQQSLTTPPSFSDMPTLIQPPEVTLDGHASALFTYIPDHIEYILFEILRNSMRFTFETHGRGGVFCGCCSCGGGGGGRRRVVRLPPIRVTVGASDTNITFRVSDQGGGIREIFSTHLTNLTAMTTAMPQRDRNLERMPRECAEELNLGLGLPMSRVYANYWGGAIAVHAMHGYGSDAYVRIATGNQMENLTYGGAGSVGVGIGGGSWGEKMES
ncbi:branched-chain alpha-ketoacid dehydrogenase [Chytridium lagenaria]|nr:branched-chain alpha-ketoacid dehydrogenase [Chytridium lagenaria]